MAEVERVVFQCPDVRRVVVVHHVNSEVSSVMIAFFTIISDEGDVQAIKREIRHHCVTSLPDYMQPKLVHVDEIPLQSHTGKIDRMVLRTLYTRMLDELSAEEQSSLNETEAKVFQCFS